MTAWLFEGALRACREATSAVRSTDEPALGFGLIVATAGYRVGYDSASQFSRDYRRQFGLPPGRDAARLRADASTA